MKKGKLLIVDDEPHLLKVLEFTLRNLAEKIVLVENGQDALTVLREEEIDCVLCDINLPRLSGIDVLKAVRARNQNTPFIFFTAEGENRTIEEAAKLGAVDFLFKPQFTGIESAIRAALHSLTYRPPADSEYGKILERLDLDGK